MVSQLVIGGYKGAGWFFGKPSKSTQAETSGYIQHPSWNPWGFRFFFFFFFFFFFEGRELLGPCGFQGSKLWTWSMPGASRRSMSKALPIFKRKKRFLFRFFKDFCWWKKMFLYVFVWSLKNILGVFCWGKRRGICLFWLCSFRGSGGELVFLRETSSKLLVAFWSYGFLAQKRWTGRVL